MQTILLAESIKQDDKDATGKAGTLANGGLLIGFLAKAAGVSESEIKFYEKQGLLSSTGKGKWRTLDTENAERLKTIIRMRNIGLSLGKIREALSYCEMPDPQRRHEGMVRLLTTQINELEQVGSLISMQLEVARAHLGTLAGSGAVESAAAAAPSVDGPAAR